MAGSDNLKPVRTKEEARERGRAGGIKSGAARRKKRDMKSALKLLLDQPVEHGNIVAFLQGFGLEEEELTYNMAIAAAMVRSAIDGNVSAAQFVRDSAGMNQASNRDYALRKKAEQRAEDEFEYKKQKEAGISYEIEDMDEIEEEIYGEVKEQPGGSESQPAIPATEEDDPV